MYITLFSLGLISLITTQTLAILPNDPFSSPVPGTPEDTGVMPYNDLRNPHSTSTSARPINTAQIQYDQNNQIGISIGSPNPNLPDPCGPLSQPPGEANSKSTCHATVSTTNLSSQDYYGVQCQKDDTGEVLDRPSCEDSYMTMCYQIAGMWGGKYQVADKWVWSTTQGNCTFGYWLPKDGAPPPSYDRCVTQIYRPMVESCGGDYNVGSVNLKVVPSVKDGVMGTGEAVDPAWPSYVMVAQKSYWGVNAEDSV